MARMPITIEGGDQLIAALQKAGKEGEAELGRVVLKTAVEIRSDIIKRYKKGPKTGRLYKRGEKFHQASAPGEAPAWDGGHLASRIDFKKTGAASAEVGTDVEYGGFLEWGTIKIDPRPAWRPAVEEARAKYLRRLEAALAKVVKRQ